MDHTLNNIKQTLNQSYYLGAARQSLSLPLRPNFVEPDVEVETAMEADEALTFEPGEEGADSSDITNETVKGSTCTQTMKLYTYECSITC